MIGYFARRLLLLIPVFLGMSVVIFMIIHLVPGDPVDHILQIGSSPQRKAELMSKYGFDRPLVSQYLIWLGKLAQGDLGDAIILRGYCQRDGFRRIGFGECRATVLPARSHV